MNLQRICMVLLAGLWAASSGAAAARTAPLIIDHTCTDITLVPENAIVAAKAVLHIAYGHTSHGSQVTSGMSGLVAFANGGGKGLQHPAEMFAWNHGGSGGALDLHDNAMGGDVGYYPDWVNNTRSYLNAANHAQVNVVMWSWCGQVDSKYAAGRLFSEYLTPMSELEQEHPEITFIYMTGHVDYADDSNNKAANQIIRDYCRTYNKVLFDFCDIESYDPDGNYYAFPHDSCDYYSALNGTRLGNWATEWQDSHVLGVDWYSSSAAHSQPLNANQKAYAAWWLWARLAGWSGPAASADLNGDGRVDALDLALLSQQWLTEIEVTPSVDEAEDTGRRRR
jgi:Dockerin type I domain